jgi:hypothetical protein
MLSTSRGKHARILTRSLVYIYSAYSTQRDKMLTDYQLQNNCDFTHISDSDKLKLLLNTVSVKPVARFIIQIFNIRVFEVH